MFDHILILGFGSPSYPKEVIPFLEEMSAKLGIPPSRLEEARKRYEAIGGGSPYARTVTDFARTLQGNLARQGMNLPVLVGMRFLEPRIKDVIQRAKDQGLNKGLGLVFSPYRSDESFGCYVKEIDDAGYEFIEPWHNDPLLVEAHAENVHRLLDGLSLEERKTTYLLFTAHSIPLSSARLSRYQEEMKESSRSIANVLVFPRWGVAYQSAPQDQGASWLGPSVSQELAEIKNAGGKRVIFVPAGFLSENSEILYDLDIEAKREAEREGLYYQRAETVLRHPHVLKMFTEKALSTLKTTRS